MIGGSVMTKKDLYKEATKDMIVGLEEIERSINMQVEDKRTHRKKKYRMSRVAAAIIVGMLTVSTVSVSAYALYHWSNGMKGRFQVSSSDTASLEKTGVADFPDEKKETKSVTKNGVTVSVVQTLVDNYYAYIAFQVKGYQIGKKETPTFDHMKCTLDGKMVSTCSSFYDGLSNDGNGNVIMGDGSALSTGKDISLVNSYVQKDGTLEYHILMYTDGTRGYFSNKTVNIKLSDLGIYGKKEEVKVEKKGTWSFAWKLSGSSASKVKKVNATLGNTGVVVSECEVSPISLRAVIDTSNKKKGTMSKDVDYPPITGVKLKDGTVLTCIIGGGIEEHDKDGRWEAIFATSRIIDVDEVESFLFDKSSRNDGEEYTEDNFYEVPINQ